MAGTQGARILFVGDVHIGRVAGMGARTQAHQAAVLEAFRRAAQAAAEKADVMVVVGDLIDQKAVWGTFIEQAIGVLRDALEVAEKLRVVLIAGNHDPAEVYRRPEWAALGNRAVIVTQPRVVGAEEVGAGVNIVALPWMDGEQLTWRDWPEGPTVVAAHACFPPPPHGRPGDCVLAQEEVARWPAAFVALGHYHEAKDYQVGAVPVVMCGAPEVMDLSHRGTGRAVLAVVTGSGPARWESVETGALRGLGTQTVQWQEMARPRVETLRRYIEARADRQALLRVQVEGLAQRPIAVELEALVEALEGNFFFLDIEDRTCLATGEPEATGPLVERVLAIAQKRAREAEAAGQPEEAEVVREAAALVVHLLAATEVAE